MTARRRATAPLFALVLLAAAACNVTTPPTPPGKSAGPGPGKTAAPTPGKATPTPAAPTGGTPTPGAVGATATPGTTIPPIVKLAPGSGATRSLSGVVAVDAAYALRQGATVLSHNGGTVLSHNGGAIVAAGAGNIVAAGAGNMVAAGAGNVLSHNGGAVISEKGSAVISHNGGQVLSHNGGQIVAAGAGNIVAAGAGNIVAAGAGNLVAAGAGNVLSHNGGTALAMGGAALVAGAGQLRAPGGALIADTSGNAIAPASGAIASGLGGFLLPAGKGAAGYRLAQAATPTATPGAAAGVTADPGLEVPAAGMVVSVVSLNDHKYLPLGQDAAGKPVYAVYTNITGGFQVFLPADTPDNVLVVASPPDGGEARLVYNQVVPPGSPVSAVDERARHLSTYIRDALARRTASLLAAPDVAKLMIKSGVARLTPAGNQALADMVDAFVAMRDETGFPADADEALLLARSRRIVDVLLAGLDLRDLKVGPADIADPDGQGELVLEIVREGFGDILGGAATRLKEDPAFFSQAFLADVVSAPVDGVPFPPIATYEVTKPGDVGDFLLVEYLGAIKLNSGDARRRMMQALYDGKAAVGPKGDPAVLARADRINGRIDAAGYQLFIALSRRLADPAVAARVKAIFAER